MVLALRRTRETWDVLSEQLGDGSGPEVRFDGRVYEASLDDLLGVVRDTPATCARVLLVGHNPGVQDLVLALARRGSDDARALAAAKYPTSALAVLDLSGQWADVTPGSGLLSTFAVPRG